MRLSRRRMILTAAVCITLASTAAGCVVDTYGYYGYYYPYYYGAPYYYRPYYGYYYR